MAKINHWSHGEADRKGHAHSDMARDGSPKRVHAIEVHPGMKTKSQSGADALSGHEASAIDSLTGDRCVPGKVTSVPGWGNAGLPGANGHPLAKAPGAKRLTPVAPAFRQGHAGQDLHALGSAILAEAFKVGDAMDRAAHDRKPDGTKC